MGLFGDMKDNMDKKRQAREYIRQAKVYLKEGKEIYNNAYERFSTYASETEYKIRQHNDFKKKIAKELELNVESTLDLFRKFDIDAKTVSAPMINGMNFRISTASLGNFHSVMQNIIPDMGGGSSILDLFISEEDYYEARRQRDEAKYYKQQMKNQREILNNYKEKLSEIRSFISEENRELDSLTKKIMKMNDELKNGMQKSEFSIKEADYLKGIYKITKSVSELITTNFLSDTFYIDQRYQNLFSEVKKINEELPYAPSISDNKTVEVIKRIIVH